MSARKLVVVAPLRSMRLPVASAQIPSPTAEPIQEHINAAEGQLAQKALRHPKEGNLTQEHLQTGLNATKAELSLGGRAARLRHALNATGEEIEKNVNAEAHGLVNKAAQRPGFEALLTVAGAVASASVLRKRD